MLNGVVSGAEIWRRCWWKNLSAAKQSSKGGHRLFGRKTFSTFSPSHQTKPATVSAWTVKSDNSSVKDAIR